MHGDHIGRETWAGGAVGELLLDGVPVATIELHFFLVHGTGFGEHWQWEFAQEWVEVDDLGRWGEGELAEGLEAFVELLDLWVVEGWGAGTGYG